MQVNQYQWVVLTPGPASHPQTFKRGKTCLSDGLIDLPRLSVEPDMHMHCMLINADCADCAPLTQNASDVKRVFIS